MLTILMILSSILIGYGTYCFACEISGFTTSRASHIIISSFGYSYTILPQIFLFEICEKIKKYLKIEIPKDNNIAVILDILNIGIQPEIYCIQPFVVFLALFCLCLPLIRIQLVYFFIGVIISAMIAAAFYFSAFVKLRCYQRNFLSEIPFFIMIAAQFYNQKNDLFEFLRLYASAANGPMKKEIARLLPNGILEDEAAVLEKLKQRLCIKEVDNFIDGFIKSVQLKNTSIFLKTAEFQMEQRNYASIKKKLESCLARDRIFLFLMAVISVIFILCFI